LYFKNCPIPGKVNIHSNKRGKNDLNKAKRPYNYSNPPNEAIPIIITIKPPPKHSVGYNPFQRKKVIVPVKPIKLIKPIIKQIFPNNKRLRSKKKRIPTK